MDDENDDEDKEERKEHGIETIWKRNIGYDE